MAAPEQQPRFHRLRLAVLVVLVVVAAVDRGQAAKGAKTNKEGGTGKGKGKDDKYKEKCSICRELVDGFNAGLEKTASDIAFRGKQGGWKQGEDNKFLGKVDDLRHAAPFNPPSRLGLRERVLITARERIRTCWPGPTLAHCLGTWPPKWEELVMRPVLCPDSLEKALAP